MADLNNPQSVLQAYFNSLSSQADQLRQPVPQQGGFLSGADPVMLALASGLLSPTKTGGFGESLGAGLEAAQGPLSEIRKQEIARADKIAALEQARAKLAIDWMDAQNGGRGSRGDDPSLIAKRNEDAAAALREEARFERDPVKKESLLRRADTYQRAADLVLDKMGVASSKSEPSKSKTSETEKPGQSTQQEAGKTEPKLYTGDTPPPKYPDARKADDGYWYVQDQKGRWNQRVKVVGQ